MAHEGSHPDSPLFALGELSASLQIAQETASSRTQDPATGVACAIRGTPWLGSRWDITNPESSDRSRSVGSDGNPAESSETQPGRKKRKRNKPTLSCTECVERKTKCDRGRPHCLSCIRRGTECVYRIKAELVDDSTRQPAVRRLYPPKPKQSHRSSPSSNAGEQFSASKSSVKPTLFMHEGSTEFLLSHVPYAATAPRNIFGVGSEYPFNNYWTVSGGLAEVICVLPTKDKADILIEVFFDVVDPIYPALNKESFYVDYEGFWALENSQKARVDADFLALVFIMLGMGTQFLRIPGSTITIPQNETAEFYSSACHQSLRLFSYLNRTSIRDLQAMLFMTYFLLNTGRATDAWAWSGVLVRQAYAAGLNREPSLINPKFTHFERLERLRLWREIMFQDTFMSMLLKLPPATTHSDIDTAAPLRENDDSNYSEASSESVGEDSFTGSRTADEGYVQSRNSLALLVQETISSPRSLCLPMASNSRQRSSLLKRFRGAYRLFPDAFRGWNENRIETLVQKGERRLAKQVTFLTGWYWYCIMVIENEGLEESSSRLSENASAAGQESVDASLRGTLEAAHEEMRAFFAINSALNGEPSSWWGFCHRVFTTSVMVAGLLKRYAVPRQSSVSGIDAPAQGTVVMGPLWDRAQADLLRMLGVLKGAAKTGDEVAKTRVEVLSNYL